MNPAWSVVFFTTLAGIGQGVVIALAAATLAGAALPPSLAIAALGAALVLLVVALGASFLHLGRPERAWRAVLMWRTSWLSREVIVLPAFIALVALWLGLHLWGQAGGLRHVAYQLD
jgi:DMSO reductase anchor subunit